MAANNLNIGVGIQDNTKPAFDQILTNTLKFTNKASKSAIIEVVARLNSKEANQMLDSLYENVKKARNAMRSLNFEGTNANGSKLRLSFTKSQIDNLTQDSARAYLKRVRDKLEKIDTGKLVADSSQIKKLHNLAEYLSSIVSSYSLLQRTQGKYNTIRTTKASKESERKEQDEARQQKRDIALWRRYIVEQMRQQDKLTEYEKKEYEKRRQAYIKMRMQQLEADRKLLNERNKAIRDNNSSLDKERNAYARGGNSNEELAAMRRYYTEQSNLSAQQAREQAREQERLRKAAQRQAREQAREQERLQRLNNRIANQNQKVSDAENRYNIAHKNNSYNSEAQVEAEIKALRQLIRVREKLNRLQTGVNRDPAVDNYRAQLEHLERVKNAIDKNSAAYNQQEGILYRLKNLFYRYFSIYSIINFGKKIVETTGYFEQQKVALEGITHSASEAQKLLSEIMGFALKSPFQTKELVGYTKQLAAFSIPTDELFETTKRLADLSAGLGVDMSRLVLAYGQVKSAAFLRGQEVRQFTEAGVPILDKLAKKLTQINGELVTTGEIFDKISKRQITFEMVADVIKDMTSEGGEFYKMQENITDTLYGQVQKLKDVWTLSLNDMGKSSGGFLMGIVKGLQLIAKNGKSIALGIITAATIGNLRNILAFIGGIGRSLKQRHLDYKLLKRDVAEYTALIKMATTEEEKNTLRRARSMARMKMFSTWGSLIGVAAGIVVGAIASIVNSTKELTNALLEIDRATDKQTAKQIEGLQNLMHRLRENVAGTKAYNEALEALKSNYKDYLNSGIVAALENEAKMSGNVADGYNKIQLAIEGAIRARNEYEGQKTKRDKIIDTLTSKFQDENFWSVIGLTPSAKTELSFGIAPNEGDRIVAIYNKTMREVAEQGVYEIEEIQKAYIDNLKKSYRKSLSDEQYDNLARALSNYLANATLQAQLIPISSAFSQYQALMREMENSPFKKIDAAFSKVNPQNIVSNQFNRNNYNPVDLRTKTNIAYIDVLSGLIDKLFDRAKNGISNEDITSVDEYDKALSNLNSQIKSGRDNFNIDSIHKINLALHDFSETIQDEGLLNSLWYLTGQFLDATDEITGTAARVNQRITDKYLNSMVYSNDTKDFFAKFLPNNKTFKNLRESVKTEYQTLKSELESYQQLDGDWSKEIEEIKKKMEFLEELAEPFLYNIKLENDKKSKQPTSVPVPPELTLAIEEIKKAWETYKTASQSQGGELGIAYMRNNEEFKKFFNGFSEQLFKGITVGTNGKQLNKILEGVWETSGFEEGAIKFEDALRAISTALKEYAGNSKHLKQFANLAKEIDKFLISTIAKYNVSGWIDQMNRALADMRREFEQTTKAIDMARDAQKKGTLSLMRENPFFAGTNFGAVNKSNANIIKDQIGEAITKYQDLLKETDKAELLKATSDIVDKIGTSSYKNIEDTINALNEQQQSKAGAFGYEEFGETGKLLIELLNKLLDAYRQESKDFTGEKYTGKPLEDAIENAIRKSRGERDSFMGANSTEGRSVIGYDAGVTRAYLDAINKEMSDLYKRFLDVTNLDALSRKKGLLANPIDIDKLEKKLNEIIQKLEESGQPEAAMSLRNQKEDLVKQGRDFNASTGSIKELFDSIGDVFNARKSAKKEYDTIKKEYDDLKKQLKDDIDENGSLINQDKIEEYTKLLQLGERLSDIGEDGILLALKQIEEAFNRINSAAEKTKKVWNTLRDMILNLAKSIQSIVDYVNSFYDVMNDGETPDWMQDTSLFLSDFAEDFTKVTTAIAATSLAVTVLIAVLEALKKTNPTLFALSIVLMAVSAALAAVVAAFKQHDRSLQHQIDNLANRITQFDNAITNLNASAERMVGLEKMQTQLEAVGLSATKASAAYQQAQLELAKKNTDVDKYKEYLQTYQELTDEFTNAIKGVVDELTGSVDNWASSMSSAIRGAFQNGENAARAFQSTIKEMIGDIVENMLRMAILEPLIKDAVENFTHSDALKQKYTKKYWDEDAKAWLDKFDSTGYQDELMRYINNPEAAQKLEKDLKNAGIAYINGVNSLDNVLKDYFSYNSEQASLSGGIQDITEDTARRLEALQNSQLGETVMIRNMLMQYLPLMDNSTYYATIQSAIVQMGSNVSAMLVVLNAMHSGFNELRNTSARPLHVTMV